MSNTYKREREESYCDQKWVHSPIALAANATPNEPAYAVMNHSAAYIMGSNWCPARNACRAGSCFIMANLNVLRVSYGKCSRFSWCAQQQSNLKYCHVILIELFELVYIHIAPKHVISIHFTWSLSLLITTINFTALASIIKTHVHYEERCNKVHSLAVTDFFVDHRIGMQYIEKHFSSIFKVSTEQR